MTSINGGLDPHHRAQLEASLPLKTNGAAIGVAAPAENKFADAVTADPVPAAGGLHHQSNGSRPQMEIERFLPLLNIEQAIARRELIVQATARLMTDGVDFGKIPGTERPTLLQPGADKLCNLFGLVIHYDVIQSEEDWTGERHGGEPFFYYKTCARAFRGEHLMGEGIGSCNSWESKYRWRNAERTCPACGKAAIIKGRQEYGGGWICFAKKGGCGSKYGDNDSAITDQVVGRKANPDPADIVNTVLKMAFKRSKVSCTINATSASEFFTQDVEDQHQHAADTTVIDTGGHAMNTQAAANYVAQQKIAAGRAQVSNGRPEPKATWGEWKRAYQKLAAQLGSVVFDGEMERFGFAALNDIPKKGSIKMAEFYDWLAAMVQKQQGVA